MEGETNDPSSTRPQLSRNSNKKQIVTLTDQQKRLLQAVKEYQRHNPPTQDGRKVHHSSSRRTIRDVAVANNIPYTTLQRALQNVTNPKDIISASSGRGRKQRLTVEEESMIADAVIEFQRNGTLLDRDCVRDLVQTLVQTFTKERRQAIGFNNY